MLYNILKDQWQTIEIDRIQSITQETEFSQMAKLLYDIYILYGSPKFDIRQNWVFWSSPSIKVLLQFPKGISTCFN